MPTKETMETIEKTLEVVEDQLETIERIPKVNLNGTTKRQQIVILSVTAAASAVVSGAIVYQVTKRRLKYHYEAIAEEEIRQAREHYQNKSAMLAKTGEYSDPEEMARNRGLLDEAQEIIEENHYVSGAKVAEITPIPSKIEADHVRREVAETINIFTESRTLEDWDQEEEEKTRTPHQPYIITFDEFHENVNDWTQATVTWFEEDDTLVDDKGDPINIGEELVGEDNLHYFGKGSKDNNVVYVRNEQTEMEFEIRRASGSFAQTYFGVKSGDAELRHSGRRPGRFRLDE